MCPPASGGGQAQALLALDHGFVFFFTCGDHPLLACVKLGMCIFVWMYVCINTHIYIYIYTYIYMCVCVCVNIHIYII